MFGDIVKSVAGATLKESAKEGLKKGVELIGTAVGTAAVIELSHYGLKTGMTVIEDSVKLGGILVEALTSKLFKPKNKGEQPDNKSGDIRK